MSTFYVSESSLLFQIVFISTGLLAVAAPFRVRDTLRFKNIYPQAEACAYHFTGYHPTTSGLHFCLSCLTAKNSLKPCPTTK